MSMKPQLPDYDTLQRLQRALAAARRAGNPVLVESILRAMEGRPRGAEECGP